MYETGVHTCGADWIQSLNDGLQVSVHTHVHHETYTTGRTRVYTLQIRDVSPMLVQCWASVADSGPTLNQHWRTVSSLLGNVLIGLETH